MAPVSMAVILSGVTILHRDLMTIILIYFTGTTAALVIYGTNSTTPVLHLSCIHYFLASQNMTSQSILFTHVRIHVQNIVRDKIASIGSHHLNSIFSASPQPDDFLHDYFGPEEKKTHFNK